MKKIESVHNQLIKDLVKLQDKSTARTKTGTFIIEGYREIHLAIEGKYSILQLLFCLDIIDIQLVNQFKSIVNQEVEFIEISKEVYQKIAYRSTTEGIIAVAKTKQLNLDSLKFSSENPLILVAEAPEKPGNIGALLRTADAAKLDAVIIANPKTDLFNPNIVRSSVGCLFTNQLATGSTTEIIEYLKKNNFNIFCAALTASTSYHLIDYKMKSAVVVGAEAIGLSSLWLANATQNIIIPMSGKIDSMNVSVSAAIIIFEAKRQRNFN